MIDGILERKVSSDNLPVSETRVRGNPDNEKIKKEEKIVNNEDLKRHKQIDTDEAIERILSAAKFFNRKIHIELEKDLNIAIVKVVDSETDEVIRQIPPEELIRLSKNADDLKGLLINKEV